jgi:ribosomal protein L37E
MPRYRDEMMEGTFQTLRTKDRPQDLRDAGVYGTLLSWWRRGWAGLPPAAFMGPGCLGWAAFQAGKDAHRRLKKAGLNRTFCPQCDREELHPDISQCGHCGFKFKARD